MIFRILAALTFFTRLPLWRVASIPRECYERVVPLWPLAGWVTGGTMALVFWTSEFVLPVDVCVLLALACRVLLTGGLHEDGFADFCDGFGSGADRKRTLDIMKDSHIGTYGVLGLLLYFLLMWAVLRSLPVALLPWLMLCGDVFGKWVSSNIVCVLPYARSESEAKNGLVYSRTKASELGLGFVLGAAPMGVLITMGVIPVACLWAMVLPVVVFCVMALMIRRRLQGYTGDCCGALFIACELAFSIGSSAVCMVLGL